MKMYTGTDIIEVKRIKSNVEKHGENFLNRVYTNKEIAYCNEKNVQKYQSYAGRFSTKEAVFKAISPLLDNKFEIEWKDIEILNDENGRPFVTLKKELKCKAEIDVSISHVESYAMATAIVNIL